MNGRPIPLVGNKPIFTNMCIIVWINMSNTIDKTMFAENCDILAVLL